MITVVIPTHNPRPEFLTRTLDALKIQTLPTSSWSLLLIDNASEKPLGPDWVAWHPSGRVVREERLGLTHARLRAIEEAADCLMVWSDDDNLLDPNYLERAKAAFAGDPRLGAAGGRSIPEYERTPPDWYRPGLAPLGCRDLGDEPLRTVWDPADPAYPSCAPIGAGLVVRREALLGWASAVKSDPQRLALGRTGQALSSGEDNDMNLTLLRAGWELAYLPGLRLTHLIPPGRLTLDYQRRIARASFRDFIRVLDFHGIRPWSKIPQASVRLRALKAWWTLRAWSGPAASVRWQGAIGQYEGRAALSDQPTNSLHP